ncbi:hypothetical protein [Flavobacterium urocaniciphilum]|uniref:Uncharacterized protein n=1 Tax=Flavobacterium urocaniciphilum TaxID=1299341 RepID=A0A1H9DTX1_9FLAO|nr:hypothetical protein [Flavobacterium urocaniciphilum]SEQ16944.1 hypothetical protein SAMN05444005_10869 [Flavobacterium urocaniciphilum]
MLKNILNVNGAQELSKKEQKEINGGIPAGCTYQTWSGTSLTNCKSTRPGGGNYSYSNGTCKAYFCTPPLEL